ncbi:hypothetical protein [Salinibaculum salinum]|uniref:hypothetical protein n=1 Tax=Salinibaculum salinum TaxID=3131996 RepID=UPI0030EF3C93
MNAYWLLQLSEHLPRIGLSALEVEDVRRSGVHFVEPGKSHQKAGDLLVKFVKEFPVFGDDSADTGAEFLRII